MGTSTRRTLIVDDDEQITEALALFIAGPDRQVVTCNDIESAQLVLERMPISEVLADVQFSGRFGFEGLALIRHVREFAPSARVILMSGRASAELREEATALGAHALLEKPFDPEILESLLTLEEN